MSAKAKALALLEAKKHAQDLRKLPIEELAEMHHLPSGAKSKYSVLARLQSLGTHGQKHVLKEYSESPTPLISSGMKRGPMSSEAMKARHERRKLKELKAEAGRVADLL